MEKSLKDRAMVKGAAFDILGQPWAAMSIWTFALFALVVICGPAWAHSVEVSAQVVGDRCFVQGLFDSSHPAAGARIQVFDGQGNALLEGTTDAKGMFAFQINEAESLEIVLTTPLGHRGVARLVDVSRHGSAGPLEKPEGVAASHGGHVHGADHRHQDQPPMIVMTPAALEALLDHALEEKLAPLYGMVSGTKRDRGSQASRLLSGVGYIAGIFGLVMYMASRKKQK